MSTITRLATISARSRHLRPAFIYGAEARARHYTQYGGGGSVLRLFIGSYLRQPR